MRALVAGAFALAIAATVLAGDGLVLAPHTHAPGTPPDHPHGLALYRFPIALLGEPTDAPARANGSGSPAFRVTLAASETLLGMSLLIVTGLVAIRLGRLRPLGIPVRRIVLRIDPQWALATPTGPPRPLPIV